jgi:uncharacterized membrane protein YfcA
MTVVMSAAILALLTAVMVGTAFLSGIFGMAGGLILIGVLLAALPLPAAMLLHAVTQMASNVWRAALWIRFVKWRAVAVFLCGSALAFGLWSVWRYVPSTPVAFILLGFSPFCVRLLPPRLRPDPLKLRYGVPFGAACMGLMLLTGVTGPLIDTYFLSGGLDRRAIVATKSACQVVSHLLKLVYFGALIQGASSIDGLAAALAVGASVIGTSAARPVLARLTDTQYRRWSNHIVTSIGIGYLATGSWMLLHSGTLER